MKIAKIILKGFQQFENFHLDLTNPETGEPVDKVCFIGPNGTGKSTLLQLLRHIWANFYRPAHPNDLTSYPFVSLKTVTDSGAFFLCLAPHTVDQVFYHADVEQTDEWQQFVLDPTPRRVPPDFCVQHHITHQPMPSLTGGKDLIIHVPADQQLQLQSDPPDTNLSDALSLFQHFPIIHPVSISNANEFWNMLIYQMKKRESDYQEYLKSPDNRKRLVEEVEEEFDKNHPEVLSEIAFLWNRILEKAGLEFDTENARLPVQLNENLQAYVKVKTSGQRIPYNSLSSGIRNYIFRLGHIRSLYFQRKIERGFLLVDEPENSLYPDLLYGLIDEYLSIIENTQFFVATHSPIIAAQFEPYERIHLDFDDRGFVTATHGVTPIGDDPNDLLIKDFQVRSIYGKEGLQKWERFLELRRLIDQATDTSEKQTLLKEYLEIGNAYNFDPDEIPQKVG